MNLQPISAEPVKLALPPVPQALLSAKVSLIPGSADLLTLMSWTEEEFLKKMEG
jgi:hypothetical protein